MNGTKWREEREKPAIVGEELQLGRNQRLERPELEKPHPSQQQVIRARKG